MATSRSTPRLRVTILLLLALVALIALSERTGATGFGGTVMQLVGLSCIACAALGRIWSSVFIAGYKNARLVSSGPYAMLRHPLYALSLLAMLGTGLTTRSVLITGTLLLVFGVIYAVAARAEDRFLRAAHAEEFASYASNVRAFVPRWSRYEIPEQLQVRPRVLWKAFLDAGSLLGLWVLLALADALQRSGLTPTWITLP